MYQPVDTASIRDVHRRHVETMNNLTAFEKHQERQREFTDTPLSKLNVEEVKAVIEEREQVATRLVEIVKLQRALQKERMQLNYKLSDLATQGWSLVSLRDYQTVYKAIYGCEGSDPKFTAPQSAVREYNTLSREVEHGI